MHKSSSVAPTEITCSISFRYRTNTMSVSDSADIPLGDSGEGAGTQEQLNTKENEPKSPQEKTSFAE